MAYRGTPSGNPTPANSPAARYAYLVTRVRNRQITMEEATELFGLMDETIRALRSSSARGPPAPAAKPAQGPTRSASEGALAGLGADDLLTAGVLMIGAGAGISAALRRRAIEGPKRAEPAVVPPEKRPSSGP